MMLTNQTTLNSQKKRSAGEKTAAAIAAGGTFVLFPIINLVANMGALGFAPAIAQSNEIKHNILSKELQTKTLSPENKIEGFIYFQLRSSDISLDDLSVHIEALETKTRETIVFDFELLKGIK